VETPMAIQYSTSRNRRTRSSTNPRFPSTLPPLQPASGKTEKAIAWLNTVDQFSVQKHRNVFPRWSLLVVLLALLAI
jgi:hypothetical protein